MMIPQDLSNLRRKDLQKLCKHYRLKANGKVQFCDDFIETAHIIYCACSVLRALSVVHILVT